MKNIFKFALLGLALLMVVSACENTELEELLDNPNSVTPENAELDLVFNNVMLQFENFIDESSDESMPYVRMMAMSAGAQYDNQDNPVSFDFLWEVAYARIIPDADLVLSLAEPRGATAHAGIAKIVKAYVFMTLVDLFGDVPFTEANKGVEFQNPLADDDEAIYLAALGLLEEGIADLEKGSDAYPDNDLFYGKTSTPAANWIKAANSLILRAHVITKQAIGSATVINGILASGNYIQDMSEDMQFNYGANRLNPDSRHPYYEDAYDNDGPGVYINNQYLWFFFGEKDVEDPRIRYYFYRQDCDETDEDQFTLDCVASPYPLHWPQGLPFCTASLDFGDPQQEYGGYWGRDHGNDDGIPPDDFKRAVYGVYPAGGKFDNDDCSAVNTSMGTAGAGGVGLAPVILSSYVQFYLAEAALTMGVDGDPLAYLLEGVRQSIDKAIAVGAADNPGDLAPSQEQIDDYIAEVESLYMAAGSDEERLDVIMKEFLLGLWGQGVDAFNNYRRTALPSGLQPTRSATPGNFPRVMYYPSDYVNLNINAQQHAITEQVFWDKLPAGAIQ
ncbi:MAG: SusD/RagB family nutrient-binding outer membrane lipoprotein [Bacteroidota bacterium]